MRLVAAVLARNEAGPDRYLTRVLKRLEDVSDEIVVLDDGSTDGTAQIARKHGATIKRRDLSIPAWGNESSARAELWDLGVSHCEGPNDWLLINDADQELRGDVRGLCLSLDVNSWAMPLYDMWSETEYREDEFWVAHWNPRIWLVAPHRVPRGWVPEWNARGIHPGHIPANWPAITAIAPPDIYWLHYGWSKQSHREQKYQQYMSTAHLMTPHERAHVESILH